MRRLLTILWLGYQRFNRHDAWAIASHISLSLLMALFPFLIILTALASLVGHRMLATQAIDIVLDGWPDAVAGPILEEIHALMEGAHGGVITFGVVFALYFSSSGVEALRIGLSRAYGVREKRSWWLLRLGSIGCVIGGAIILLTTAFLLVLSPQVWQVLTRFWPATAEHLPQWDAGLRLFVATAIVTFSLVFCHKFIPIGRRSILAVLPGIILTLVLWLVVAVAFSWYVQLFPGAYSSMYGGLATAMVTLIFVNMLAAIFLYGGEINGLLLRRRIAPKQSENQHP